MSQTTTTDTMQAILQREYGTADTLHPATLPAPEIGRDEVLVRVRAASFGRHTWHLVTGRPYLMRVAGFGLRRPKAPVPRGDIAGTVEKVGTSVTRFAVGDEVFGIGRSAFAELAAAREDKLAPRPEGLSWEQAAVLPVSSLTALQAVRDAGRVQPGQHVLVLGASGGVGTFAVQIAKAFGAQVTGVSSSRKLDLVRSVGADHVMAYDRDDVLDGNTRYDVILDFGGNNSLRRLRRALTRTGTLVIGGGEGGGPLAGGIHRQLLAAALSPFVRQRLTMLMAREHRDDLEAVARLVEEGSVTPVIDARYSLAETPDAMRHLESGHARGKIAVTV